MSNQERLVLIKKLYAKNKARTVKEERTTEYFSCYDHQSTHSSNWEPECQVTALPEILALGMDASAIYDQTSPEFGTEKAKMNKKRSRLINVKYARSPYLANRGAK